MMWEFLFSPLRVGPAQDRKFKFGVILSSHSTIYQTNRKSKIFWDFIFHWREDDSVIRAKRRKKKSYVWTKQLQKKSSSPSLALSRSVPSGCWAPFSSEVNVEDAEEPTSVETPRVIVEIQSSLHPHCILLREHLSKKGPRFHSYVFKVFSHQTPPYLHFYSWNPPWPTFFALWNCWKQL